MPPVPRLSLVALALLTASASLVAAPRRADACSPPPCFNRGYFVPGDGATVPANLPAIYWRGRYDSSDISPTRVTLTTAADPGTPLPFTATPVSGSIRDFVLVPAAPLVPGTQYVLTDANSCSYDPGQVGPRVTFTAGPTAPLPTTLGTLTVTAVPEFRTSFATSSGSCSVGVDAAGVRVAVDAATAPDVAPWLDVLHVRTFVDGIEWAPRESITSTVAPGASWEGRAVDLVVTICSVDNPQDSPGPDLGVGVHDVEMRATLPGSTVAIASETATVTLDCAGPDTAPGGCLSTTNPGAAAGLAFVVTAWLLRRRRTRRG